MPIKHQSYGFPVGQDSFHPVSDVTQKTSEHVRPSSGKQRNEATTKPPTLDAISKPGQAGKCGSKKSYSVRDSIPAKVANVIQGGTEKEKYDALAKLVQKRDFLPVLDFVSKFGGQEKKNWTEEAVRIVAKQLTAARGDLARDELKIIGISLLEEGAFGGQEQKQDLRGYKDQFKMGFEALEETFLADASQNEKH